MLSSMSGKLLGTMWNECIWSNKLMRVILLDMCLSLLIKDILIFIGCVFSTCFSFNKLIPAPTSTINVLHCPYLRDCNRNVSRFPVVALLIRGIVVVYRILDR